MDMKKSDKLSNMKTRKKAKYSDFQNVEVTLVLGHRAVQKEKVSPEGFSHDWTVFVRGDEGNNIQHFVEKVVFYLHESFPKPKRVVKEPPFSVTEAGYAGFIIPIDVYFRTKEEPKKVNFEYNLYLRVDGTPASFKRTEKLTFQNPSEDFRCRLIKAGGLANALTGSAAGGSDSLSTQACAPSSHAGGLQSNPPKPSVAEKKKPRSHVPNKDLPSKPAQPPPPKPSQTFTDIFGTPIRTTSSDSSSVKSKESGHSSQTKNKVAPNNSAISSNKEEKPNAKESHKSKDSNHSRKDSHPPKNSHPSKYTHPPKDSHHQPKDSHHLPKDSHHQLKDSHSSKEVQHVSKETHHSVKEHPSKEGHKTKDSHHSSKEGKSSKDTRPLEPKNRKPPKPMKSDKELNKSSSAKRAAPSDSDSCHGNVEKKKKPSPVSAESSEKSSSQSKHKAKEGKSNAGKHKIKPSGNSSSKKEGERPQHKSSLTPKPPIPPQLEEPPKPKSSSPPFQAPSPLINVSSPVVQTPPPIIKPLSSVTKPPSPDSTSMDSDSDESQKSFCNKSPYRSPASSISESSLHGSNPISGLMSDHSILSPLSDEDDSSPSLPKRKLSSECDMEDGSPEFKPLENKSMQKLKKKHHSSEPHKSLKSKHPENYHEGNGSINNDISIHHSPSFDHQNDFIINTADWEELLEMQRIINASEDLGLLQDIVDVIGETENYEITATTFEFDMCSLEPAVVQKIKECLLNYDKYV